MCVLCMLCYSLHQQKYLTNQLFPNDHDNSHTSQTLVGKSVQEQTELVTQLLQRLEEVDKLKAELLTVRQDMVTAQRECRELMAVLDKLTAHQDDPVKLSVTKTGDKDSPLHRYATPSCDTSSGVLHSML